MPRKNKITLGDVAEAANVSKMTVSRVLNRKDGVSEETRRHVLQVVEELGYQADPAARSLRGVSSFIGVIVADVTTPFVGEVLRAIFQAADHYNYGLLLYAQGSKDHLERSDHYISLLKNGLVGGVILLATLDYDAIIQPLKANHVPYVLIDHYRDHEDEPAVHVTNRAGIQDAMRHLMALGHRRIGFITGRLDARGARDRLQGYYDALAETNIPIDQALVLEGDYRHRTGFDKTNELLRLPEPPTAIVASNDSMAFGAMEAIKAAGLVVGHDISLIGFDDVTIASQVHPPLTTVRQPMDKIGTAAVELLMNLIEGKTPMPLRREIATQLIIRESTGVPKPGVNG